MSYLLAALEPFMGPRIATLPGRNLRVDMPSAAFLNAVSANVLDFDDTHWPTIIHPGAPILPPLLALCSEMKVSGADLLNAFALGMEVECRLGITLHPTHYARGWHITSTCGTVGAAAAAAKLMGLDETRIMYAMGIAANCASGLVENLSSMAKSVGVGNAARNGLMAAYMAQAGVDAAATALEGPFGFLQVFGDHTSMEVARESLGTRWELLNQAPKPYPSCAVSFPVIDAILDIRSKPGFTVNDIAHVQVRGNPLMLVRAGRATALNGREAKLSIRHSVAIAMLNGRARVQDYMDSSINDPATAALALLVDSEADSAIKADAADVKVTMKNGTVFECSVTHSRGTPARPLKDEELSEKALGLLAYGAPNLPAQQLLDGFWSIDTLQDMRDLLAMTVPSNSD